jgi:hypothetical protein
VADPQIAEYSKPVLVEDRSFSLALLGYNQKKRQTTEEKASEHQLDKA